MFVIQSTIKWRLVAISSVLTLLLTGSSSFGKGKQDKVGKVPSRFEIVVEEGDYYIGSIQLKLNEEQGSPGQTIKIISYNKEEDGEFVVVECTPDSDNIQRRLKLPLNFHKTTSQRCGDAVLSFIGKR